MQFIRDLPRYTPGFISFLMAFLIAFGGSAKAEVVCEKKVYETWYSATQDIAKREGYVLKMYVLSPKEHWEFIYKYNNSDPVTDYNPDVIKLFYVDGITNSDVYIIMTKGPCIIEAGWADRKYFVKYIPEEA